MRTATFLLALGLIGSAFAAPAPIPQPAPNVNPALFAKDPLSIHRRSAIPQPESEPVAIELDTTVSDEAGTSNDNDSSESAATAVVEEPAEDSCVAICGVQRVEGAKSEREALCSADGLKATLTCAQCIDSTWPDTTWEDSAMAEYERIVSACQDTSQRTFRRAEDSS